MSCIFCKIVAGEVPAKELYRDESAIAIADLNPQAPSHLLVIPQKHYATISELASGADGEALAGHLVAIASRLAGGGGFRLVVNTGEEGGQTVDHVHVHALAGRRMTWPPG